MTYGDSSIADVCILYRQRFGGGFLVYSPKVDNDDDEPRQTEGCGRRLKQQVEIAGVCKRREGRNT
jgi:hypothetical protein